MHDEADPVQIIRLDGGGTTVVLEYSDKRALTIHYWGPHLGVVDDSTTHALIRANRPQQRVGDVDDPHAVTLLPSPAEGWTGTPAFEAHRGGRGFSHRLTPVAIEPAASGVIAWYRDDETAVQVRVNLEVTPAGLIRQQLTVDNLDQTPLEVTRLDATFPIPDHCKEVLDLSGRWMRERVPQRHPLTAGRYVRESRKGRSGADGSLLLIAGEPGFGFDRGEVRSVHVAWSGNHSMSVERSVLGGALLSAGELLLPGEIILQPGESYSTPWVYAGWGNGLDDMAARFHAEVRASHPHRPPRAALLNVWEAVYFDHQLAPLQNLADRAAEIGLELYVLDDGWFLGRRDDRRALGDWFVDPQVWPDGLTPLIDHVRARGLRFGIWVEPEMVSVDSRLAQEHPDWILRPGRRLPPVAKWQHVLNVANPEVFDYLHARIDWLLANHQISYLKWDHNRDVLEPGDAEGRARLHDHVSAVYRLLDTLRASHPTVEFENCASGGSRIDLELLARTHRTWVSDCTDPIERARIQQYTGLLLPLEMIGNDIAVPHSHQTGRTSHLDLRGTVALLGWLGVQWDLTQLAPDELSLLGAWIELYREARALLHGGRVITLPSPDPAVLLRAVVSEDQEEALVTVILLASSFAPSAGRLRLPGLHADGLYDVRVITPGLTTPRSMAYTPSTWVAEGVRLSGRMLALAGLELPVLDPEQGMVISVRRLATER